MQERAGHTVDLVCTGYDLLNRIQMAQEIREIIDKCVYMKSKSFCWTKEMVSKLKRLLTEWEKIFASYLSDKRLITSVYRILKTKLCKYQSPNEEMDK
jgi:hypothetical protein